MKTFSIFPIFLLVFMLFACKDVNNETKDFVSPADTPSTLEDNYNELDTVPENASGHIHFIGSGTEPFWSIEIEERKLVFESPDKNYKTISGFINTVDVSGDTTTFKAEDEYNKIEVTLMMQNCTDGMSDKNYSHKVHVSIKRSNEGMAREYKGCGNFK